MSSTRVGNLFQVGERVVVQGLSTDNARQLNGCHGAIAFQKTMTDKHPPVVLYVVHLDRLKTVMMRPDNLCRELIDNNSLIPSVSVMDGVLESDPTSPGAILLCRTFAMMRWVVATQFLKTHPSFMPLPQIMNLTVTESAKLNAYAIEHWNKGVCACLIDFSKSHPSLSKTERSYLISALSNSRAMKSWYLGLQDNFWFVGRDSKGVYLVPDSNQHLVYRVVGICDQNRKDTTTTTTETHQRPLSLQPIPVRRILTIVPWMGCLLYDSTAVPPPNQSATDNTLAHKFHETVLQAIQNKSWIEKWVELE